MRIAVVDIGGTSVKSGLWEDDRLTDIRETDTNASRGGEYVMQTVLSILREQKDVQAIGISTAGQVNSAEGSIVYANENLPGYTGMKIRERLEKEFHVPVAVQNDVNSAAVGEGYYGAGKGHENFLCLTYGTGVGGAIVTGGKIYSGAGYSAGEFGAIVVHPEDRDVSRDSFSGCYERYASTTALVQLLRREYPEIKNGREIFARLSEDGVRVLVDQWIGEIVYGLTTLVHIFNPSLIILGGGVMEQPYVMEKVKAQLKGQIMSSFADVEICPAKLGNTAGMLGAAQEALRHWKTCR